MSTRILFSVAALAAIAFCLQAQPDWPDRPNHADKILLKPTRPNGHSLYLDYDSAIIFVIGRRHHQFELTAEQLQQLREQVLKFQSEMPKEHEVAQQAREGLEKVMSADPPDEEAIPKISGRAILADSILQRGRLQFWLELRQRFGREVFEKIQQTIFRHQHGLEAAESKSAIDEIFPQQKPILPAKD